MQLQLNLYEKLRECKNDFSWGLLCLSDLFYSKCVVKLLNAVWSLPFLGCREQVGLIYCASNIIVSEHVNRDSSYDCVWSSGKEETLKESLRKNTIIYEPSTVYWQFNNWFQHLLEEFFAASRCKIPVRRSPLKHSLGGRRCQRKN